MVASADYLVLPGVGAFADCKKNLTRIDGMVDALTHITIDHGRPFWVCRYAITGRIW